MSLDVSLYTVSTCPHCGHYLGEGPCVFSANITHNLNAMAAAAGIYEALWRPEEMLAPEAAKILHDAERVRGHHSVEALAIRAELPTAKASDLITPLREGLQKLRADPDHYRTFEPENKWGTYDVFVPWIERYLAACEEHPTAIVEVCR